MYSYIEKARYCDICGKRCDDEYVCVTFPKDIDGLNGFDICYKCNNYTSEEKWEILNKIYNMFGG